MAGPRVVIGRAPPFWRFPFSAIVGVWLMPALVPCAVSAFTAATMSAAPFAMQAS